jgi:alkylhydroperoxidase/carboxymuconolactone decarboxylase family protein YurZ
MRNPNARMTAAEPRVWAASREVTLSEILPTMSDDSGTRQRVQLTRGLLEAWNRRDLDALMRVLAAVTAVKALAQERHALIVHIARYLDNAHAAAEQLALPPG